MGTTQAHGQQLRRTRERLAALEQTDADIVEVLEQHDRDIKMLKAMTFRGQLERSSTEESKAKN